MPIGQVGVIPAFKIRHKGDEVIVDHRTFTLAERRKSRKALLELAQDDELAPDYTDQLASLAFVVLTRTDPQLTIFDLYDQLDTADIADGDLIDGEAPQEADDPEA